MKFFNSTTSCNTWVYNLVVFFFLNGQRILQIGYRRNSPHRDTLVSEQGKTLT
ncbi:hypothetical protein HanXRQr2_Chr15g0715601 [Helianthus annuus]|uniref:Uncharacterized protein n=1 Tax=Helianthus annuus TaxID=4232 RepID=A0A9K3E3S2_HELAN|nr:hypothetical protein HanXRQr2_Chr15g0715601 [Helianthus annuus]KAJ0833121.1 hypothetical protein HanPSC8_Chr15g0686661 [Helianthus annuus]